MSNLQFFRINEEPLALENLDLQDKKVLVRVDFNCPVKDNKVTNNYRIRESLQTLKNLSERGVKKITLITHWERPEGKYDPAFSLEPIRQELENLWGEKVICPAFISDFNQYSQIISKQETKIVMWENIRFWPEEENGEATFSQALAQDQDLFINEAFSASHRKHASIVGITEFLPSYAGWHLAEEVKKIYHLVNKPINPSIAIVGGAKIETKVPVLEELGQDYDRIILGGKISLEYENSELAKSEALWTKKVTLPKDYLGEEKMDISEESAQIFAGFIRQAKKILWNGPMGKFESVEYRKGSEIIARAIAENQSAERLIGGGDTIALLEILDLQNQVGFTSTGGGAMLEYIAKGTLPGLEKLSY